MTNQPRALTDDEIRDGLASRPDWTLVSGPLPGDESKVRTEICRTIRFASFEQALEYMQAAVPFIGTLNHHPRWENVYRTLSIALSTHDIGDRVSALDFELAKHFDELSLRFNVTEK